jgi:PilZ domain
MRNRRKTERFAARGAAKIHLSGSPFLRDCLVTDVSDGGVRLYVEGEVPDEFALYFGDATGERRACRVVWRLGHEIGVAFADASQHGFGRRAAGSRTR